MVRIRAPKDFWSGVLFIVIGGFGVYLARDYAFGSTLRMGPGYMPTVLSWLTAVIGVVVLLRSFVIAGDGVSGIRLWPLLTVLLAIVIFGLTIERLGLVAATALTAFVGGLGSREGSVLERVLVSVGLAVFCGVVFVTALGQPMQLWPF
jgi:hypothetical protein